MQLPEESNRLLGGSAEPEVPAQEQHRVEGAEALVDLGERENARVVYSASAADLNRTGRDVDGHGLELPSLDDEAVSAGARADVERASLDVLEGGALGLGPVVSVGEEPLGAERRPGVPVVALELGLACPPFQVVEE